jgi:hypothetical protein
LADFPHLLLFVFEINGIVDRVPEKGENVFDRDEEIVVNEEIIL